MRTISQPQNQQIKLVTDTIPGPLSNAIRQEEDALLADGLQGFALKSGIVVDEARGNIIKDVDGNELLDIIGGIGVNGLGHSHPKFLAALQKQMVKSSVGSFTSQARVDLLKKLNEKKLGNLSHLQLYSSGAEAVESALRLAKNYTGKHEIVSFSGGFHGKTQGVLGLMGSTFKNGFGPYLPGNHIVPYANAYRSFAGATAENYAEICVDMARRQLKSNSSTGIAAFIIEPLQGTAGNIIPPDNFLPMIKDLAQEFDALLIADEMITGFGRSGTYWGCDHSGVIPDMITVGKQFGGGFPLSGVISTKDITSTRPWGNPSGSSSSYGGNPLASAAALSALSIIEEEGLVENARETGRYFLDSILHFKDKYSFIGDVRGRGLFMGIEMVKSKETKEPLSMDICGQIFNEFLQKGLLTMAYTPSFRIQPSMTIDKDTINNVVEIMENVFQTVEDNYVL